eukprot:Skav203032  [mRNA]  locus=scaffold583:488021:488395:+ [translate_table: standard]
MATSFLLPSATALPLSGPPGTPVRHGPPPAAGTGALGVCLTALGAQAALRRSRRWRATLRAQRPTNARDGKTIPQGGSWLFPSIDDDELYEEMENELPPKKSLEDSVYCCWVTWQLLLLGLIIV